MRIEEVLKSLSLKEKASLCYGKNSWYIGGIERLGIPGIELRDGPHGLRKEVSKCYPNLCLMACSWDRALLASMAESLAQDYLAAGVGAVLGPGINLKRLPVCGRNFEYFSEDPLLTGELASAYVDGLQSNGVQACVKHFCCYNQENERFSYSSEIDEATLRELYLRAFEIVIRKSKPGLVMTSYNRLNGVYTTENRALLEDILRGEWGYEGVVVSDWGSADSRVESVLNGLDVDMPGCEEVPEEVLSAIDSGEISEETLDRHCRRILRLISNISDTVHETKVKPISLRKLASESMVLLKNRSGALPLSPSEKVAVIGAFAKTPRIQGGGCAKVEPQSVLSPFDEMLKFSPNLSYALGYGNASEKNCSSAAERLISEAETLAKNSDKAVIFAGIEEGGESEAYDRADLSLPEAQTRLIQRVSAVNPNTVVVLSNGGAVDVSPWAEKTAAILETYYAGQEMGGAAADILYGRENPSGRLAESFPFRFEDCPASLYYPGDGGKVYYGERMFVGYRYYVSRKVPVAYPFGYGLSYTNFGYESLKLSSDRISEGETLTVRVTVKNTGKRSGREVVQIYLRRDLPDGLGGGTGARPAAELAAFDKVELAPGESRELTFELTDRVFRRYDENLRSFVLTPGIFRICACRNAGEVILGKPVKAYLREKPRFDRYTTVGQILRLEGGAELCNRYLAAAVKKCVYGDDDVRIEFEGNGVKGDAFCQSVAASLPLRGIVSLSGGLMTERGLEEFLSILEEELT